MTTTQATAASRASDLGAPPLHAQQKDNGGHEQQQRDDARFAQQHQVQVVRAQRLAVMSDGSTRHALQLRKP